MYKALTMGGSITTIRDWNNANAAGTQIARQEEYAQTMTSQKGKGQTIQDFEIGRCHHIR